MRWLLHGTMTPAVADALRQREDQVQNVVSLGLTAQSAYAEIVEAARKSQLDVMTNDAALVDAMFSEGAPSFGRSIVYLQLEGGDVEQDDAVARLFQRYRRLAPGRLYTVTGSRVKIRQLPGQKM